MAAIRKINGCLVDTLIIASGFMALVILLTGCAIARTPAECGTVKAFSSEWQHNLALEIAPFPDDDPIVQAVLELKRMRNEVMACQEASR